MERVRKIKVFLLIFVVLLFLIAGFIAFLQQNWIIMPVIVLGLFSSLLPSILEKKLGVDFNESVEIIVLLFVYAYFYLGEYMNFFSRFWWWDLFLHGIGLFLIGLLSFSIFYLLNNKKNIALEVSPFFIALFSFSFAVAVGTSWEIFEFLVDSFFGLNMQKSGLVDTMGDLIVGLLGAMVASFAGYIYLRKNSLRFYKYFKNFISYLK